MKEEVPVRGCERENDLIDFLYGQLNDVETRAFRKHMNECGACSAEFAAFTEVRESVVAWRNESLAGLISPAARADLVLPKIDQGKPSALAALREFFSLSPLWMKGAVAFASLLFCLFAVLAAVRWRDTPPAPLATTSNIKTYSEQELQTLVEQRIKDELQRLKNSPEQAPPATIVGNNSPGRIPGNTAANRNEVASGIPRQRARRPLSKIERQELAADLRLISAKNESELDLLDDQIRQ